ncbi:MAG: CDP-diacylglycerol--glycerol-3-phosphate 3-phosphatidyltransferase [Eubacteriales bacterium]
MKMNLPNKLTVLRLCLVPVIIIFGMLPTSLIPMPLSCFLCAVLFIGTSVTDMLDGKIARKRGLITDFGKFLDPVADKFMVIGAMFVILYKFDDFRTVMIITLLVVVFRELAVTSMRLVVSTGNGIVIAANKLGKIKTVSQIVCVSTVFLERVLEYLIELIFDDYVLHGIYPLSWATIVFTVIMTVWSGANYLYSYWKYLDPEK